MTFRLSAIPALTVLLTIGCSTTAPLPPPSTPEVTATAVRIDPRFGGPGGDGSAALSRGIAALNSGRLDEADAEFARAAAAPAGSPEALLGRALVAFQRGDIDAAESLLDRAQATRRWPASEILEAEIAVARGDTRAAIESYEQIAVPESAAAAIDSRVAELRRERFDELFARANAESAETSVSTLREALEYADAEPARLLLARRLIELGRFDEARRALDQLQIRGASDADQLQELLAEVEVGKGRYQEAIARLEPLARRNPQRYEARLEEIKRRWSDANMPGHYHVALQSDALTRADLATILYWRLPAVRFARNLSEPPIAVDLADAPGREEMIRALALGLFPVDPITRTAAPGRLISGATLARIMSRILRLQGVPACAVSPAGDPEDELSACGVPLPAGEPVTGADAARTVDAVAALAP